MCDRCKDHVSDAFVKGMATILWGSAWGEHVQEHGCRSLAGVKIEEAMPKIPEVAWRLAERLAGKVEEANGRSLAVLFSQALKPIRTENYITTHEDYWGDLAERFGECLAHMAMGSGVSWYDDHPEFKVDVKGVDRDMAVPSIEEHAVKDHADDACEVA